MLTPDLQTPMRVVRQRKALLAGCFAMMETAYSAHAARPMITDDARITDAQACQMEAWQKVNRGSRERWAFPACNPTGNLEITLGANDLPDGSGGRNNDYVLQGKTLFRVLETNGYGWGLAAGMVRHADPRPGQQHTSAAYFYVPFSASFRDDFIVLHLNLGAQDNRDRDAKPVTYGAGTEISFTRRLALIAEAFGDDRGSPYYQAGIRLWAVPGRFQIDATYGAHSGEPDATRWWTIGVRLISPAFMK